MEHYCEVCASIVSACYENFTGPIRIGSLDLAIRNPCPVAKLICLAMDEHYGLNWITIVSRSLHVGKIAMPVVYFKNGPGAYTRTRPSESDQIRLGSTGEMHRLSSRIILMLDKRLPGITSLLITPSLPNLRRLSEYTDFELIGELELLPVTPRPSPFVMRHPRRPINPTLDTELAVEWLKTCDCQARRPEVESVQRRTDELHQHNQLFSGDGFWVIDVVDCCLVQVAEACDYMALSYVWGAACHTSLRARLSNVRELCKPGALFAGAGSTASHNGKKVARTTVDAMSLVKSLGYRYLWVDALCILQDDPDERRRLIHGMGLIYENALCTIIDAAGEDADQGLCGVTPREYLPYEVSYTISRNGFCHQIYLARPSLLDALRRSKWHTRGWTYQEICLSPRSLYFTPHEVFFSCQHYHRREGYSLEGLTSKLQDFLHTGPSWLSAFTLSFRDPNVATHYRGLPFSTPQLDFETYRIIVTEYTRRHLTYSSDILNAFGGIFHRFVNARPDPARLKAPVSVRSYQGIPPRLLPMALLWFPLDGRSRRRVWRDQPNAKAGQPQLFSAWSWVSWDGPVGFAGIDDPGLDPLIHSYKHSITEVVGSLILRNPMLHLKQNGPELPNARDGLPSHNATVSKPSRLNRILRGIHRADRFGVNTLHSTNITTPVSWFFDIYSLKDQSLQQKPADALTVSDSVDWWRINATTSASRARLLLNMSHRQRENQSSASWESEEGLPCSEIHAVRPMTIRFWAIMVASKITVKDPRGMVWKMSIHGLHTMHTAGVKPASFKFDPFNPSEKCPDLDSFIATLVTSDGAVYGVGVKRCEDGTYRRVGIGLIFDVFRQTSPDQLGEPDGLNGDPLVQIWEVREVMLS